MAGLAALALAYVLSQFYRSFLAVLAPSLTADLGATKAQLSLASGALFFAFAVMQLAVGVWLDRYGPRRTVAVLIAVGACGAFLFAAAQAPWMVSAAMALIGAGIAPVLMAGVFIFARSYKPARLAALISWLIGIGTAGNVIGTEPLAAAVEAFGWRPVMAGLGVVTLLVSAGVLAVLRDPVQLDDAPRNNGFAGYLELLRLRALWPLLPLVGVNYAAVAGIRGLWAGPYLADVYGLDLLEIGRATLFMALAMAAGSFLYGPLDTVFGTRKWVAFTGNLLCLLVLVLLALNPDAGVGAATIALVMIGLTGTSFGLVMAHGRAFVPAHLIGRGVTLLNFFAIGTVGLIQLGTGVAVTEAAVPGEPAAAYSALFWFYALVLAIALFIYLWARDARPQGG